jgi:hypothetical protein
MRGSCPGIYHADAIPTTRWDAPHVQWTDGTNNVLATFATTSQSFGGITERIPKRVVGIREQSLRASDVGDHVDFHQ